MEVLKLTPKELAEMTMKDLANRRALKEKGKREAESFVIDMTMKINKRIRNSKNKCRSRF